MVGKIAISVAAGLALFAASVRLPAAPCLVTNTPGPRACAMDCCGSKTCCLTSHERTGPPKQPLAKAPSNQQNIAAVATQNCLRLPIAVAREPELFSNTETRAHSSPTLALICIRLI